MTQALAPRKRRFEAQIHAPANGCPACGDRRDGIHDDLAGGTAAAARRGNQIAIDADDIAGVVTSESRTRSGRLGHRRNRRTCRPSSARSWSPTTRVGTCCPICRRKATFTSGFAATASLTRAPFDRRPGGDSPLTGRPAPDARTAARVYPGELLVLADRHPGEDEFPGTGPIGQRHRAGDADAASLDQSDQSDCNVCHQIGNQATREIPASARDVRVDASTRGTAACRSGRTARHDQHGDRAGTPARPRRCSRDWTDRIARRRGPAGAAASRRASNAISCSRCGTGAGPATFAHDELTTDKRNPTANAYGPIYGVDWGNDGFLIARSARAHGDGGPNSGARPEDAAGQAAVDAGAVAVLGQTSRIGSTRRSRITRRWTARGASGCRRGSAVPENQPAFCANHPSAALAPQPSSFRQIQYFDPQDAASSSKSTSASTRTTCSSRRTRTRRSTATASSAARSAGSTRAILDETGDAGAAQGWCRAVLRRQQRRQDRSRRRSSDSPSACIYSVIAHPTDGSVWGAVAGADARQDRPHRSEDLRRRSLRAAVQSRGQRRRLHAARHRRRFERRDLDGAGEQRSSRELRPPQVQDPVGARGDGRPALPRRLDALSACRARASKACAATIAVDLQYYNFVDRHNTLGLGAERSARERHELGLAARAAARRHAGWCCACPIRSGSSRVAWMAGSTIRTAAGKAAASTRTTARTRSGTSRVARARAARS